MIKVMLSALLASALILGPQDDAKKSDEIKLDNVKCCMMPGQAVKANQFTSYNDAKVFFCCGKCKAAFEKDPAKYAVKANMQLVETKQFVQKNCPFSGQPVDDAQMVKIGNDEVKFCCGNCLKKVAGAADDKARAEMVFSDAAFKKGFVKAEAEKAEPKKNKKGE